MNKEEAIKYLQQLYPNGGHCLLDEQRIETIGMAVKALQEQPVSEDLNTELDKYIKDNFTIDKEQLDRFGIEEKDYMYSMDKSDILTMVEHFTNWQKEQMMKGAVEAVISQVPCSNEIIFYNPASIDRFNLPQEMNRKGLEKGDKVKLVIIKGD